MRGERTLQLTMRREGNQRELGQNAHSEQSDSVRRTALSAGPPSASQEMRYSAWAHDRTWVSPAVTTAASH